MWHEGTAGKVRIGVDARWSEWLWHATLEEGATEVKKSKGTFQHNTTCLIQQTLAGAKLD